jgi:hypothetical protein
VDGSKLSKQTKGVTEEEALKQIGHLPEGRQPEVHSWHEVPEE